MKGIGFTLDALFALMITAAGITVILYFVYSAPTPAVIQYSSSSALVSEMSASKLSTIIGIPLVQRIVNQSYAFNQSWMQQFQDEHHSGGNPYGPYVYDVAFTVNVPAGIQNGSISAAYGNIYFGASNIVYAMNATTGKVIWTAANPFNAVWDNYWAAGLSDFIPDCRSATPSCYGLSINATAVYDGMLIYASFSNTTALNAYNGSLIWTSGVPYVQPGYGDGPPTFPAPGGEPDGDEIPRRLLVYNGKIITGAGEPISGNDGPVVFAYYANNGSLAGSSTSYPVYTKGGGLIGFAAVDPTIVDGQIFTSIYCSHYKFASCPGYLSVNLITNIYNSTSAGALIWGSSLTSGRLQPSTNPATYGNVIAIGEGGDADVYSSAGALIGGKSSLGGITTGVSSYNGHLLFQGGAGISPGYVAAFSSLGVPLWQVSTPAGFGPALINETPSQSSHNIYTIWGNGYAGIQNLSTGTFTQSIQIPYNGNVNPYPVLAYGKLYVSVGNTIVAFGACQANANSSVLVSIATMYLNNEGSCADYILNSLQNMENTTFTINNQSIITKASFLGNPSSRIIVPYSQQLSLNGPFTVSLWFNSNVIGGSAFTSKMLDGTASSGHTFDLSFNGGPTSSVSADIGNGATWLAHPTATIPGFLPNTWYNVVGVFTDTGYSLFINGNNVSSGTYSGTPSLLGASSYLDIGAGSTSGFSGSLSDLQVYSAALSNQQISQIYQDGLSVGPPVSQSSIVAWFPLAGDGNGYGRQDFPGFPSQVTFNDTVYNGTALRNSYSITSQSVPVVLQNYTTGTYSVYHAGVYSWK